MTQEELAKSIKSGTISGAFIFEGEEESKKEGALRYLLEKLLPEGMELMNETVLENPSIMDVLDASRQFPFMCDKRVVIAKDPPLILKSNKSKSDDDASGKEQPETEPALGEDAALKTLSEENNETCVTIIYIRGKLKGTTAAFKWFDKQGRVVSFEPLSVPELMKLMQKSAKKQGYDMSMDVAELFVTSIGTNLTMLNSELDKLIGYKNRGTQISEDDVFAIISQDVEANSFLITEKICAKQYAQAYRILNSMLDDGEYPGTIQASLTWQIRNLCHCAVLKKNGIGYKDAAVRMKSKEYPIKKSYEQCSGIPMENLVSLYRIAVDHENNYKKGLLDPKFALDDLLSNMCRLIVRKV